MRKFYSFLFSILIINIVIAQTPITLTQSNVQIENQFDWKMSTLTGVSVPSEGENQTWNYANLFSSSNATEIYTPGNCTEFPSAFNYHADSVTFGEITLGRKWYYAFDVDGFRNIGVITDEYKLGLLGVTGNQSDSLIFPLQADTLLSPSVTMQFPETFGSQWTSNPLFNTNFSLTVTLYGINNAPGKEIQHVTETNQVVGWGNIVVPTEDGTSIPYPVLLVKTSKIMVDSFFLNNAPASPLLLGVFDLTQGNTTANYYYHFYRENSNQPVLIMYCNSSFNQVLSVAYDATGLETQGIENQNSASNELLLFQNPASNNLLITTQRNAEVTISDLCGRVLLTIDHSEKTNQIDISHLAQGTYFVTSEYDTNRIQKKLIISR